MENNNNTQPTFQNNYYAPIGQQINHVDKIEAHFDKDMGITVDGQDIMPGGTKSLAQPSPDKEWIGEIAHCFYGIEENALEFVAMARKMRPVQIVSLVNAWLKQKKISDQSCQRDLWKPLHSHGIYNPSESNWNSQLDIPR